MVSRDKTEARFNPTSTTLNPYAEVPIRYHSTNPNPDTLGAPAHSNLPLPTPETVVNQKPRIDAP